MRGICALALVLLNVSCASISPRFDQPVASTFASESMRKLVTEDAEIYYPEGSVEQAKQVAARATECVRTLRAMSLTGPSRPKVLLFLTPANFNNAYVNGQYGGEPLHSLNPLFVTAELFQWQGFTATQTGDIACHEMMHYVQFEQLDGFWRGINTVFGDVMPSQTFLESWFAEGIAQYYEGRIRRDVGRTHNPLYNGVFEAFITQQEGKLAPGDLSPWKRDLYPYSGAYLVSLQFVEWLAGKFGPEKLWEVMNLQGRSFFTPFGVTLRFKSVYGSTIGTLFSQWAAERWQLQPRRTTPSTHARLLEGAGQSARLAAHAATGSIALISAGADDVPRIRMLNRDGAERWSWRLAQLFPTRSWVIADPHSVSGLSFTRDGNWLFLFNDDLVPRGDTSGHIWKIDARTGEVENVWRVAPGLGGAVKPDGSAYTYVEVTPGHARIVSFDLHTEHVTALVDLPDHESAGGLSWSPDGNSLLFSESRAGQWQLFTLGADQSLTQLTTDGFNYGAKWIDDTHLTWSGTHHGRLQAHTMHIDDHRIFLASDAPHALVDVAPFGDGRLVALSRIGTKWSVETLPLAALEEVTPAPAQLPVLDEAARADQFRTPALQVQSDEPYSSIDHLFVPQLRAPFIALENLGLVPFADSLVVSLSLSGKDRLGKHSWAINGWVRPAPVNVNNRYVQVSGAYRNLSFAPVAATLSGSIFASARDLLGNVSFALSRTYFTVPVSLSLDAQFANLFNLAPRRFVGPSLHWSYFGGDSTAYGGTQRGFGLALDAAWYVPGASTFQLVDLRAQISIGIPLPFTSRHSFVINLTGRLIPGPVTDVLTIGGFARGTQLSFGADVNERGQSTAGLPSGLVEYVRGFDGSTLRASRFVSAAARYRHNITIDRGVTSLFNIFPSVFFREVGLEAFGAAAFFNGATQQWARSAGVLVDLRTVWGGQWPASLYYQFAWRFDAPGGPLHSVGLSFD